MTKRIHDWTESDNARLEQAVLDLEPYAAACEDRGWPRSRFWDAVTGRMAPEVCVSGKACLEQWKRLQKLKPPPAAPDGWDRAAALCEEYERDLALETYERLVELKLQLEDMAERLYVGSDALRIEAKLNRLLAELGVKA